MLGLIFLALVSAAFLVADYRSFAQEGRILGRELSMDKRLFELGQYRSELRQSTTGTPPLPQAPPALAPLTGPAGWSPWSTPRPYPAVRVGTAVLGGAVLVGVAVGCLVALYHNSRPYSAMALTTLRHCVLVAVVGAVMVAAMQLLSYD